MKYCYIVNPVAGQKEMLDQLIPLIRRTYEERGLDFEIAVTEYPRHATEIARRMSEENETVRICAVGGDGTLNEVVCGIVGRANVEVGCFSSGSGNDFIKYFGRREDFLDFEYIVEAKSREVDVIQVNDRYCVNIFSMGIDANVAYDIPRYRRLPLMGGAMAYHLSLVINFFKKLGRRITISINGEERLLNCLLLAVGNGRVYGGGYYATPEAILDDGILDVVAVETIPRIRMAQVIPTYKNGKHLQDGKVIRSLSDIMTYDRAETLHISAAEAIIVNLDGEPDRMREMDVSVIRNGFRFLLPKEIGAKGQGRA